VAYAILIILALVYLAFFLMFVVKLVEALVRIFGGVGFHRTRHVVDSGLYGAYGLAGWCGSRPRKQPRRQGQHHAGGSGSGSGPGLRLGASQMFLAKPGIPSVPTPSSSAPPSVLRPEHALQPYREESDDEDGYIMGAWHSYPKPGYSAVEDQSFAVPTPPSQKSSGFTRVGGGRAHFDTPYAIQSDSTSLERQSLVPHHGVTSPELDSSLPPPSFKFGTPPPDTSTPSVGVFQNNGNNNNPPGSSGNGGGDSGPPRPTIGLAPGRHLPHGAMLPAHLRTQSQSADVVHPGLTDPFPGPSGSGNGTGASNTPGKTPSPMRAPPIRNVSEDSPLDSPAPKKPHWLRKLRNKGHSDSGTAADEEAEPPTGASGDNPPGRSFHVVRKDQGQGQSHNMRPSTSGSSGDDAGQKKGSFVVLRGRDVQPDSGHGGLS